MEISECPYRSATHIGYSFYKQTPFSVQLRPTVRPMAKALEFDVSLLERLYTHSEDRGSLSKTMLDVQYRSPQLLNAFPSQEFYEGRLKTSDRNTSSVLDVLKVSMFPWPLCEDNESVNPTVFIQCSAEEDMGGRSKSNAGQVHLVSHILPLITEPHAPDIPEAGQLTALTVTVLSPYTKQVKDLRQSLPLSITCSTIDSYQGRESDIIIFSAVRCNAEGEVGFLDDPRRLNVMWTRAKLALIIVGDRTTMAGNALWKRALDSCVEIKIPSYVPPKPE